MRSAAHHDRLDELLDDAVREELAHDHADGGARSCAAQGD
jgi:hypothetical protein